MALVMPTPATALLIPATSITATTRWQVVVDAYLDAAIDSKESRRAYRRNLMRAFTALGITVVAELTGAHLAAYRAAVTTSALSPSSQSQVLASLRAFLSWARTMGAHPLPLEVVQMALRTPRSTVRRPYQVLSESEVAAILTAAPTARDKALLAVLLGGGLRVSEACNLDVADVMMDQDGGAALYVRQGKGRKDRAVPVQPDVIHLIRTYLARSNRHLGTVGPLFSAHDRAAKKRQGGRITARAVGEMVQRCTAAAHIEGKRISPHSLRHTFAIRALRTEGNVVKVSKLLGHASITTTSRYVDHLALGELRSTVPSLPIEGGKIQR